MTSNPFTNEPVRKVLLDWIRSTADESTLVQILAAVTDRIELIRVSSKGDVDSH